MLLSKKTFAFVFMNELTNFQNARTNFFELTYWWNQPRENIPAHIEHLAMTFTEDDYGRNKTKWHISFVEVIQLGNKLRNPHECVTQCVIFQRGKGVLYICFDPHEDLGLSVRVFVYEIYAIIKLQSIRFLNFRRNFILLCTIELHPLM